MRILNTLLFCSILLLTNLTTLSAQKLIFDVNVTNDYLAAGTTELDLRYSLTNPTTEPFSEIKFVSDLYNWKTDDLIADLSQELSDVDPNGNGILDGGETWELNIFQPIDADLANTFVVNGGISAVDMFGNLEREADAEMIKIYGINMDVEIVQDCVEPGQTVDVMLISRLLIDEDAAKDPGTTTINVGGIPITITLPKTQWEARDLTITVSDLNDGQSFDPFNPPAGLGVTNFCEQGGADYGRNTGFVLDECEPIETIRAPCTTFGEDDIICEYPDWVFCYSIVIPPSYTGTSYSITASDDFLVWKAEESPAGSGTYGEFIDISANIETGGVDTDELQIKTNVIPVELISFEAEKVNNMSELTWQTASEINNSHFAIERSVDGITYEEIGSVKGYGTTTDIQKYSFTDVRPAMGMNYYRLVQYDFDGTNDMSEIRALDYGSLAAKADMRVYPNPTVDFIHIDVTNVEENITVMIFDKSGKLVIETQQNPSSKIDITELPTGQYTVKAIDANDQLIDTRELTKLNR